MGRVDGKVALISGGARGMGAAHARALVAEGAKVVIGDQCASVGSAHPPSATADQCNFSVHASHDASRYRSGLAN